MANIAIVHNPQAGNGRSKSLSEALQQLLQKEKIPFSVFGPPWPDSLQGFTAVWLIGGEGTLNHYINQYADLDLPLALFKGGSGNDFAWKLYGNKGWQEYAQLALTERPKKVDAGVCNGWYFINGFGVGFDGEVVKSMANRKIFPSHLSYLLAVWKQLFLYRSRVVRIEGDELVMEGKCLMAAVANGARFGGGFLVAPQARLDDGWLDLIFVHPLSIWQRIRCLPVIKRGKHLGKSFVTMQKVRFVRISAGQTMDGQIDGERIVGHVFQVEVLPSKFSFFY